MKQVFTIAATVFTFCKIAYADEIQSRFIGPVSLKVWQHWQPSWNVEQQNEHGDFELIRSLNQDKAHVELRYFEHLSRNAIAILQCESLVRTDQWSVAQKSGPSYRAHGALSGSVTTFEWENAQECLDRSGKNIAQKINFRILDSQGQTVYRYAVTPMYVRGKKASYWNNAIEGHSAHGGGGNISIATQMAGEQGWDKWMGTVVRPKLDFVDRNTLFRGAFIGLHRHENNQEMYLVEAGKLEILAGIAPRIGATYQTHRQWDEMGQTREVAEFEANGGWIEYRTLTPGEMSVIVPAAQQNNNVFFHGARALSDSIFWTMGSRN